VPPGDSLLGNNPLWLTACHRPSYAGSSRRRQSTQEIVDNSERSSSASLGPDRRYSASHHSPDIHDSSNSNPRPASAEIARGIDIYFKRCHRQPVWCFEREDVSDFDLIPDELACSILALTSRFSRNLEHLPPYGNDARVLIMLRIANGTVALTTIESLCLLSFSSFMGLHSTSDLEEYKKS
jgi:hypothetical protein